MSLELLNKRLQYYGGGNQQQRMIKDKERSLKKALLYSYQAETAILPNGNQFRCLINPDKNKPQYDNKIISIPFKDICLNSNKIGKTSEGEIETNIKCGDVFTWKQTESHWLVYLQYLEENAYFRSQIRRCDQTVKIGESEYWVYIRGPVETSIEWTQKAKVEWNTMNYSLVMYITADDITWDYFHRFQTLKIYNPKFKTQKTWQVVGVDPYYGDGIIQVFLDEWFENSIADAAAKEREQSNVQKEHTQGEAYISGPRIVNRYNIVYYEIINATNGKWFINYNGQEKDLDYNLKILSLDTSVDKNIKSFTLIYRRQNQEDIKLENIEIISI